MGNHILPTYDLFEKHFAYLWFKNWYFTHLRYALFVSRYPPLLKTWVNLYFCYPFMFLSFQNIKKKILKLKIKKKEDLKYRFCKNNVSAQKIKVQAYLEQWYLVLQIKPNNRIFWVSEKQVQVQYYTKLKLKAEEPK